VSFTVCYRFFSLTQTLLRRRLSRLAKKTPDTATPRQESTVVEQRNILRTRIKGWEQLCPIYMPGLLQFQADTLHDAPSTIDGNPEDTTIWLPSKIPESARVGVCQEGLAGVEEVLRTAQCHDALEGVRNILKIKTRMIAFKNRNIRGQRQGTRSRAVIDRVHERARNMAEKYRAARSAKLELSGPGSWEDVLCVLKDGDVRGYQDADRLRIRPGRRGILEDGAVGLDAEGGSQMDVDVESDISLLPETRTRRDGTGETRRTLSWIWQSSRITSTSDEQDDILRAEWAKSRARAARTSEEVLRLKEEMRRVLKSLEWKGGWWKERMRKREDVSKSVQEGLESYASTQRTIQLSLAREFRKLWKSPLEDEEALKTAQKAKTVQKENSAPTANDDDDDDSSDDEGDEGVEGDYTAMADDEE